jgi:predicted hydrocarbon binding protein
MVHGSIIGSRFAFAEQRWGSHGKQYLIDKLPLKEKKLIKSPVFECRWFDFSILDSIDTAIRIDLAKNDKTILHQLGRFSAEYNYRRLPAKLVLLSPDELLKNSSRIKVLFQDFGDFQLEEIEQSDRLLTATLVYRYPQQISESYCSSALGYLERLLELAGYRVVLIEETHCQSRGDLEHRYRISWEPERIAARAVLKPEASPAITPRSSERKREKRRAVVKKRIKETEVILPERPEWLTGRAQILLALIVFGLTVLACQLLSSTVFSVQAKPLEKIYDYSCRGSLKPVLRVDRPNLLIKTDNRWSDVKIVTVEANNKYAFMAKQMAANTFFEIGLGEFLNSKNRPLNLDGPGRLPKEFLISAVVNEEKRSCSCQAD